VEFVVVDNASTDDSVAFLHTHYPTVRVIQNKVNEGFAKGYNIGLAQIQADVYVLLNSDVEVTPNWITPIAKLMQHDATVGAVQPVIINQLDKTKYDYAGAAGGYIDNLGYPLARGRVMHTLEPVSNKYNNTTQVFWASGAALFVKAALYKQLGGLDESFFAHQEEIDLCWRIQLAGYKVMACHESTVYHVGGATLVAGSPTKTMLNFRNNLKMLAKNLPFWTGTWVIGIRIVLDAVAAWRFLLERKPTHFMAVAKAHIQFFKWRIFSSTPHGLVKKSLGELTGVVRKNVVYHYFIKRKKTFEQYI
jgi:hypothetical protein